MTFDMVTLKRHSEIVPSTAFSPEFLCKQVYRGVRANGGMRMFFHAILWPFLVMLYQFFKLVSAIICAWLNSRSIFFCCQNRFSATILAGMKNNYKAIFCVATAILVWNGRRSCKASFFCFMKKVISFVSPSTLLRTGLLRKWHIKRNNLDN